MQAGMVLEGLRDRLADRLHALQGLSQGLRGTLPASTTPSRREAVEVLSHNSRLLRAEIRDLRGSLPERA